MGVRLHDLSRRRSLKVLVIGSGGREHTLVWKIAQSPKVSVTYAAPGNAGTAQIATNIDIKANDLTALADFAESKAIDLTVVGPEAPLAQGIADLFISRGIRIFGPTKAAAEIESSKVFAKELMQKYGIPSGKSRTFSDFTKAKDFILEKGAPLVVKADGLAAGKGVIVANTTLEALQALSSIMELKTFGSAGDKVVIEEKLDGKEVSYFAFSDGENSVSLVPACDYKRVNDGDQGPNTGGMGSYSQPIWFTPEIEKKVNKEVISSTIKAMVLECRTYTGLLYAGLMVKDKDIKVLEFNARFGDPETQVTLPRLKSDIVDIMLAVTEGKLENIKPEYSEQACVGVVMASGGYPGEYKTGYPISGLNVVDKDILVFHAGTRSGSKTGEVVTAGGRVLTVVALGRTFEEARGKIYDNIQKIKFRDCHYRKDIALIRS